jgi:hypothetical protein
MDKALQQIVTLINDYVAGLIDVADMTDQDKADLKTHLKAAEDILLRNGNAKLQLVIGEITKAVLSRF